MPNITPPHTPPGPSPVVSNSNKKMELIADNCVGCHLCEIACSYVKFNEFNPTKAFVTIQQDQSRPGYWLAEFTENCDVCGYCFAFCHYDAITLKKTRGGVASV